MPKFKWRKIDGRQAYICEKAGLTATVFDNDPAAEIFKDWRGMVTYYHPDPEMQGDGYSIHMASKPTLRLAKDAAEREMLNRSHYPPFLMIPIHDD